MVSLAATAAFHGLLIGLAAGTGITIGARFYPSARDFSG
jgi:hypothetical protein